ncbi:MAG: hypothetical protein AABX14_05645 [Candidatus Aenigmatarchaeota archaeon]
MAERDVYLLLERMVRAVESNRLDEALRLDKEFSTLLYREFRHLPNWSMDERVVAYDRCAQSAAFYANGAGRENLELMRKRFSSIKNPQ